MDEYMSRSLIRQCWRSKSPQRITSANRIFSSIRPDDTLFDLSSVGQTVIYPAGSHLFRQNTPADSIFEIKSGLVLTYHIASWRM
jgi:CRP-like cAMP-binding protein